MAATPQFITIPSEILERIGKDEQEIKIELAIFFYKDFITFFMQKPGCFRGNSGSTLAFSSFSECNNFHNFLNSYFYFLN